MLQERRRTLYVNVLTVGERGWCCPHANSSSQQCRRSSISSHRRSSVAVQRRPDAAAAATATARASASAVGGGDGSKWTGDAKEPGTAVSHRASRSSNTQVDIVAC